MPPRLPPGKREVLKTKAFAMSVEDNLSNRAIARELSIDPRTVGNLLREATAEAREDRSLIYQKTLKGRTKLLENLSKTLEKEGVSPHARAQLAHAANSTLDSIDLLAGTRSPAASRVTVSGRIGGNGLPSEDERLLSEALERMSPAELWAWDRFFAKLYAREGDPDRDADVIKEIIESWREGILPREAKPFADLSDEEHDRFMAGETIYVDDDPYPYGRPLRAVEPADVVED
jgi:hypothetical protein